MPSHTTSDDHDTETETETDQPPITGLDHEAVNDHTRAIYGILDDIANRGYAQSRVFSDWVSLCLATLLQDDDTYHATLSRYDPDTDTGREIASSFANAFARLAHATTETQADILGEVHHQFGVQSDRLGQHFTPHLLTEFMTDLSMPASPAAPEIRDHFPPGPALLRLADAGCTPPDTDSTDTSEHDTNNTGDAPDPTAAAAAIAAIGHDTLSVIAASAPSPFDVATDLTTDDDTVDVDADADAGADADATDTATRPAIHDPAGGSGRFLVSAARRRPAALFTGRDVDPVCAKSMAINACLLNVDAVIVHGDSLAMTCEQAWRAHATPYGGHLTPATDDDLARITPDTDE